MNLRHMEIFRAVMATGSVSGAAELLHVSQPAASKLLGQAVKHSGLNLFDRVKGRLVPTPEARQLYAEVENLWRGVEHVRSVTRALADPGSGSLRLAVSASLSSYLVPRTLALLYQQHPRLQVSVETLVPSIMTEALLAQASHLGVCMLPNAHPNLAFIRSYRCGLACVMPHDHPLAAKQKLGPADLKGQRLIGSPAETPYGQVLQKAYGSRALSGLEARSSFSACMFAAAGAGVAVVDAAVVSGQVFSGLAVRPYASRQKLDVHIIHNRYRPVSVVEAAFCDTFDRVWKETM